ncbi:hypothetical protein LXL04_016995 [Taraxacum kok-saghyz]
MLQDIYNLLKCCFDCLEDTQKTCFFYSALYPEDSDVKKIKSCAIAIEEQTRCNLAVITILLPFSLFETPILSRSRSSLTSSRSSNSTTIKGIDLEAKEGINDGSSGWSEVERRWRRRRRRLRSKSGVPVGDFGEGGRYDRLRKMGCCDGDWVVFKKKNSDLKTLNKSQNNSTTLPPPTSVAITTSTII